MYQHWSFVRLKATRGAARTSFRLVGNWNCEYGLFTEWLWFFTATDAICSGFVLYLPMGKRGVVTGV